MSNSISQKEPSVRYWDDVDIGDEIAGFSMFLDWTAMARQVSGSQDWNLIHHDPDYAKDSGHNGVFYNTGWTAGLLGRALSDWAGLEGWVCKMSFQMRGMNMHGDTVSVKGVVTGKQTSDDHQHLVNLDIWLENDRIGKTTPSVAVVRLPKNSTEA